MQEGFYDKGNVFKMADYTHQTPRDVGRLAKGRRDNCTLALGNGPVVLWCWFWSFLKLCRAFF